MTREIEVMGVRICVPEHPRFAKRAAGFCYLDDAGIYIPLTETYICAERRAFESACCIAIVWWEDFASRRKHSEDYHVRHGEDLAKVSAWRSLLGKAGERE